MAISSARIEAGSRAWDKATGSNYGLNSAKEIEAVFQAGDDAIRKDDRVITEVAELLTIVGLGGESRDLSELSDEQRFIAKALATVIIDAVLDGA